MIERQRAPHLSKARRRVNVEHYIGYIKICRIGEDTIRIRKARDKMMEMGCGLVNFKLKDKNKKKPDFNSLYYILSYIDNHYCQMYETGANASFLHRKAI